MKKILFILLLLNGVYVFPQEEIKSPKNSHSWQPFVTGGISIGEPNSFRLQTGIVKKWGGYVAGKTNFRFEHPGEGVELSHFENDSRWAGPSFFSRWAIYAGPMIRLSSKWMLYFGIGFGKIFEIRETTSGQRFYEDQMFYGGIEHTFEIDFGFVYRFKSFLVSAGFSSTAIIVLLPSVPAANISLGYIFPASKK